MDRGSSEKGIDAGSDKTQKFRMHFRASQKSALIGIFVIDPYRFCLDMRFLLVHTCLFSPRVEQVLVEWFLVQWGHAECTHWV